MILVADTECNGLYNEATRMWCFVAKEVGEDNWFTFYPDCGKYRREIRELFTEAEFVVIHNGLDYDSWVLDKLRIVPLSLTQPKTIDTLVLSTVLNPDRVKPKGVSAKAGPHSLEAWAARLGGQQKVENTDWTHFTERMLDRCRADVEINERVYKALLEEMRQ